MAAVIVFLLAAASVLICANLRNAITYTEVLLNHDEIPREEVNRQRNLLLLIALTVAALIVGFAFTFTTPDHQAMFSLSDRLIVLSVIALLIFSQLYEQWALQRVHQLSLRLNRITPRRRNRRD